MTPSAAAAATVATAAAAPLSPLKDPAHVQSMMRVIEAEVAALRAAAQAYESRRAHSTATLTFTPAAAATSGAHGAPLPLQTNLAVNAALPSSQFHPHVPALAFPQARPAAAAARLAASGGLPPNPRTPMHTSQPSMATRAGSNVAAGAAAAAAATGSGPGSSAPNKAPAAQLDADTAYKQQLRRREIMQRP